MAKDFNRSSFLKQRHTRAKSQQKFFEELTGEKGEYSSFLGNETPLTNQIAVYEVSYQMSYQGGDGSLFISSPETFKVYAVNGQMSADQVYQGTKDAVINMKSPSTNKGFHLGTQKMIDKNLKVNVDKVDVPRGIEQGRLKDIDSQLITNIQKGKGFHVEANDQSATITGGRPSGKKDRKRSAKMKTDLSLYI